jgi:hypothetical protein
MGAARRLFRGLMARLLTTGWEIEASSTSGSPDFGGTNCTRDATKARSGAASLKCAGTAAAAALASSTLPLTFATGQTVIARAYMSFDASPTATVTVMRLTAVPTVASVRMTSTGTLILANDADVQIGSASSALSLDGTTFYRIELSAIVTGGSAETVELRINGTSIASGSSTASGSGSWGLGCGWLSAAPGKTANIWVDDVAVNDATGGSQNTWPGDAKVVLLKPTADSAVGTGWTKGNTGAAPLFQNLDDTPPSSDADLTANADTMQIRNATSNANTNYDATMTTYTAAGVGATDTVNVVVPLIATGAPVTTSSKQGTVGVVSNPTITNVALGAGGSAGAFWSGVATGVYPTGIKWSLGTTTYAPSVTLGTAPVMRVTQVTSSTRIAIVAEMFMYIDYTPSVIPIPFVNMARQAC